MTIAEWCLLGAVILYLMSVAPVKPLSYLFGPRKFDNSKPRDPAFYEWGIASRALGAHQNGVETFPLFAAAVLLAEFRASPQGWIDDLALLFVAIRVLYVLLYLGNLPTLRTLSWNAGFFVNVTIFLLPMIGHRLPTALPLFHG